MNRLIGVSKLALLLAAFVGTLAARDGRTVDERPAPVPQMQVTAELRLPARVRVGDAVPITIRLTNTGRQRVELSLQGRTPLFDLVVTRPDGTEVWSRLHGASTSAILMMWPLEPGASLELSDRWGQRDNADDAVAPGRYLVRGIVPSEGRPLRTAVLPLEIRVR